MLSFQEVMAGPYGLSHVNRIFGKLVANSPRQADCLPSQGYGLLT